VTARRIQAVALGSYYKPRAPNPGPDAQPFRGLVWWAKNNRATLSDTFRVAHPQHPRGADVVPISCPGDAYAFFGETVAHNFSRIATRLTIDANVLLVPIPSSEVTPATLDTARWPARRLAEALEAQGIGKVTLALAHRRVLPPRHEVPRKAPEIASELVRLQTVEPWEPVAFVDDLITWGDSIAAADHVLETEDEPAAIVVGFTEKRARNACELRRRMISYDSTTLAPLVEDIEPVPD